MLCRAPIRVTNTLDVHYGCDKQDMGVTTKPRDPVAPLFNLNIHKEGDDWKVQCNLTGAVEGTNDSVYLGAGTYPTGLAWYPQHGGFGTAAGQNEIYAIVSDMNSNRSRDAELEHCNDWVRAFQLTFEAAENAIRFATPGLGNRRFASRVAAYRGALEAVLGHSTQEAIARIFKASIKVTDQSHDFYPQIFKDQLTNLYMTVGDQTIQRDQNRWHHFEFGPTVPTTQLSIMDRMMASGRDYRNIQPSGAFHVGVVGSVALINLPA
ncbi:MAG TPA: hypothetical protein VGL53_16530 [Bryobacteraceae bacterium]|jgi:hypothetical protein